MEIKLDVGSVDPLVFALGGGELRLGADAEEQLLNLLIERALTRARLELPQAAPEGDLLKARVNAIHAGLVPVQTLKQKRSTEDLLMVLRHRNRASA